jgi:23S rRNA (adenine1618-N6)-methyltransferase
MSKPKRKPAEKLMLHPRNLHRGRYEFDVLIKSSPDLKAFVFVNQYGDESIDFSNPESVKALNRALLKHFYSIEYWDIPQGYLCPPIPGRVDYVHYLADLLAESNGGSIPTGNKIKVLDVGTGANCVYPIIGNSTYGWNFVGSDVDPVSIESAQKIITLNKSLNNAVTLRLQPHTTDIFKGIIKPDEFFDLTICNPPFHVSLQEAQAGTTKKLDNLGINKNQKPVLNFGGQRAELWYPGGEAAFISRMIAQSILFSQNCFWFSTLVSKKDTLTGIYKLLAKTNAVDVKTINMAQGQKVSRAVSWTFLDDVAQKDWVTRRQA